MLKPGTGEGYLLPVMTSSPIACSYRLLINFAIGQKSFKPNKPILVSMNTANGGRVGLSVSLLPMSINAVRCFSRH